MRVGVVRVDRDGALQGGDGVIERAAFQASQAEIVQDGGVGGLGLGGLAQLPDGFGGAGRRGAGWRPGIVTTGCSLGERQRFFLKTEAKTFAWLSRGSRRQPRKSFLVLFFKKEQLH